MVVRLNASETLEDRLRTWARSPSQTETEKCENAVRAVKNAIAASDRLRARSIKVIPQGSYRNRTNVRGESDVDVGVVCYDVFFPEYPAGTNAVSFGNVDATYAYPEFKNDVEAALVKHFGRSAVHRGNKAFDVHENSYRVDADVAAFFEHRRYSSGGSYLSGVELRPDADTSRRIINWPEHHYTNGNAKNDATRRSYRGLARILKNIRMELVEERSISAECVTGFLCECLAWNTPNDLMMHDTYSQDLRAMLVHLFNATRDDPSCSEWGEVSELKYLFRTGQRWSRAQANDFVTKAWQPLVSRNMLTRLHVSLIIALAAFIWATSLLVGGIPITWHHAAPFTITVTVLTGACIAFDRWLWKWRIFRGWLVKQPNLQGSWKVRLISNWVDPATGQQIAPIECVMVIRQRFSSLNARLYTRESSSTLLAYAFTCDDDGIFELIGTYRNTPRVDLRGQRSEIHHGSLLLQVKGDPPDRLDGHYWTDRGTKGSLQLSQRVDVLYSDYDSSLR